VVVVINEVKKASLYQYSAVQTNQKLKIAMAVHGNYNNHDRRWRKGKTTRYPCQTKVLKYVLKYIMLLLIGLK
jgi:hypothetical protein